MNRPHILRTPREVRKIGILGDVYRLLVEGAETGGRYALFEASIAPGSGPPPHIHRREDEGFYILEGEMTFQVGDERFVAEAGTFTHLPMGGLHTFKNESDQPVRMLITIAPAGVEQMFLEVSQPVADDAETAPPPTQADIDKLLEAAPRFGIEIKQPLG